MARLRHRFFKLFPIFMIIIFSGFLFEISVFTKINIMKKNEKKNSRSTSRPVRAKRKVTEKSTGFVLPSGVKFDDIYMDASQVAQELNISKRVVRNIRISGRISHTNPFGKVFYYRQEIAAILEANKKNKKQ